MTVVDSLLIAADNNRAVGKFYEALNDYQLLQSSFDQMFSDDINSQINHGFGLVYFKQKDYQKAIEYFTRNLTQKPNEEKWLVPEAYFQIGRSYLRLGDKSKANKYFEKAESIDYDYDFKNSMDNKIKNELTK